MIGQLKQRIRVFCLTCGKALAALVWLLCMNALMFYTYMCYRDAETLTFAILYLGMSVVGVICFGCLIYDWYRRGKDKRSNSDMQFADLPVGRQCFSGMDDTDLLPV